MAKFNHDLPAGEISANEIGAAFWQAPHTFDANHNHIHDKTGQIIEYAVDQKAPALKTKGPKVTETPAQKKERQQGELDSRQKNPNTAGAQPSAPPPGAGGINLLDWAEGKAPKGTMWFSVKKQMEQEGYEPVPQNAAEAREAIKAKN